MSNMKRWASEQWRQLTYRDQVALLVLAAALVLALLYFFAWRPLAMHNAAMRAANSSSAATLASVQAMADEFRQLRAAGATPAGGDADSLAQVVDRSIAEAGLVMTRFQPGRQGDVQVRLDGAQYETVLRWLHELELEQGIGIRELSLVPDVRGGMVNVTIRLYRP